MKRLLIFIFLMLVACGCGNAGEVHEVNGDFANKEVLLSVDAREMSERVDFYITVQNNTDEEKTFEFRSGQKYELIVTNESGEEVYRYSKGKMFTQSLQYLTLKPEEYATYVEAWDYEQDGKRVKPGNYKVLAVFKGQVEGDKELTASEEFTVPEENQAFRSVKIIDTDESYIINGEANIKEGEFLFSVEGGHDVFIQDQTVPVVASKQWSAFSFKIDKKDVPEGETLILSLYEKDQKHRYHTVLVKP